MRKSVYAAFALVVGGLLLSACGDKDDQRALVPNHMAILSIRVGNAGETSSSATAETRAPMTRAGLEDDIQTVDILAFKSDPVNPHDITKGTFFYRARGTYQVFGVNSFIRVELIRSTERQTLVVLVNARKQVDAVGPAYGEQRAQIMKRLKMYADAATGKIMMNAADGMPMWGELRAQTVDINYGQSTYHAPAVSLERMVAKISIDPGTEQIQACHYYHGYKAGFVVPDNTTSTPTLDAADASTLPYVDYIAEFPAAGGEGAFYVFGSDNVAKAATDLLTNNFITVKVTNHKVNAYWYRVDLMNYNNVTLTEFYNIIRNRHYKIQLTESGTIDVPGADTEQEAIRGKFRLKCKIVPWYNVNQEVKVGENMRLKTDKAAVVLERDATSETVGQKLTITTEYTGGWKFKFIPPWLKITPESSSTDGTTTITIKAERKDIRHSVRLELIGRKSAVISKLVRIEQLGKTALEFVADYNLAGGFSKYGTKPSDGSDTPAQTDADLRWATSHDNNQSGYYNWYVCKGVTDPTYNSAGHNLFSDAFFSVAQPGHGYHLPSFDEWKGLLDDGFTWENTPLNKINKRNSVPSEYGGIKRFYNTAYIIRASGLLYALRFLDTGLIPGYSPNYCIDNSAACAFRYERVGSMNGGNNTDHLKVQCVFIGDQDPLPALDTVIAQESWWNDNEAAGKVVTRIFPATGKIDIASAAGANPCILCGNYGNYWSSSAINPTAQQQRAIHFMWNFLSPHLGAYKRNGFAVRLFKNND